jgi:drug/metabolite transporter (DMT)-like permease
MFSNQQSMLRTSAATVLAMVAFAANSILCRLALQEPDIDAAGFTAIRLTAGAGMLLVIARLSGRRRATRSGSDWASAAALFLYAILFSFAYLRLDVGTGTLILFALVQATMILCGLARGERPRPLQWLGLAVALGGLAYLVSPGLAAPSMTGSLMMGSAGVAWGVYSLRGRGAKDPMSATTDNFVLSIPMVLLLAAVSHQSIDISTRGALLAVASGAIASGVGYAIWYTALRGLSATRAASVQLSVPVLAAAGGLMFLGESISLRLVISAVLILGGVGFTLLGRERGAAPTPERVPAAAR